MKKTMTALLFTFFFSGVFAQPYKQELPETKEYFLQKSKKQKTLAWVMMGGGALLGSSGYVLFIYEGLKGEGIYGTKAKIALAMFYGGGAAVIGSIPLFIASARNKVIAMSGHLGLKMENNISQQQPSFAKASYPALSIKIKFQ